MLDRISTSILILVAIAIIFALAVIALCGCAVVPADGNGVNVVAEVNSILAEWNAKQEAAVVLLQELNQQVSEHSDAIDAITTTGIVKPELVKEGETFIDNVKDNPYASIMAAVIAVQNLYLAKKKFGAKS